MVETSFFEMRCKEIVNVCDGRRFGQISDIIFEGCGGKVLGFVVPSHKGWNLFGSKRQDIFIPYHCIVKVGEDVILVDVAFLGEDRCKRGKKDDKHGHGGGHHGNCGHGGHDGHHHKGHISH